MAPAVEDSPGPSLTGSADISSAQATAANSAAQRETEQAGPGRWNFGVLVSFLVVMRSGWIFKTESIIMPAVLDSLGGAAWLRGCLPLLNRFGQSVPPLLAARQVKIAGRKKWILGAVTLWMSLAFLALSSLWWLPAAERRSWWVPVAFLGCYTAFFVGTGIQQLCHNTLVGKLVKPTFRGRLMLVANLIGATTAISCVAVLLPRWLNQEQALFGWVFGFSALCFAVAGVISFCLREPEDQFTQRQRGVVQLFMQATHTLAGDRNFRRLALVAACFGSSLMLFPHYQALGLGERVEFKLTDLIWWVIIQNAGTALFSMIAGPVADWRGNRLVLQCLLVAICGAPLLAIGIAHLGPQASWLFPVVFLLVGLTPVTFRVFHHYTLEVAKPTDHPRYLSTLSLCLSAPIFLSPAVGWLVDRIGFDPVFLTITVILGIAWLISFTLDEPRRHGQQTTQTTS